MATSHMCRRAVEIHIVTKRRRQSAGGRDFVCAHLLLRRETNEQSGRVAHGRSFQVAMSAFCGDVVVGCTECKSAGRHHIKRILDRDSLNRGCRLNVFRNQSSRTRPTGSLDDKSIPERELVSLLQFGSVHDHQHVSANEFPFPLIADKLTRLFSKKRWIELASPTS